MSSEHVVVHRSSWPIPRKAARQIHPLTVGDRCAWASCQSAPYNKCPSTNALFECACQGGSHEVGALGPWRRTAPDPMFAQAPMRPTPPAPDALMFHTLQPLQSSSIGSAVPPKRMPQEIGLKTSPQTSVFAPRLFAWGWHHSPPSVSCADWGLYREHAAFEKPAQIIIMFVMGLPGP